MSRIKSILILAIISLGIILRGTKIITLLQTNSLAIAVVQEVDLSLHHMFSTSKETRGSPQHDRAFILYENSQWFARYHTCITSIENLDPHYAEFCTEIPYLGLGLLRVVNQDHTNRVSEDRDSSSTYVAAIQQDGTHLAIVAVNLLELESPPAFVWANAGRLLHRITILMNGELAPYLVAVRSKAVESQPHNSTYRRELGEALLLAGLSLQAVEQLNYAVSYDAEDDKSYDLLALAYYRLADLETAEWYAREALSLNPTNEHTYYRRLGEICEARKDIACAIESYRALLKVRPSDAFAQLRLEELVGDSE